MAHRQDNCYRESRIEFESVGTPPSRATVSQQSEGRKGGPVGWCSIRSADAEVPLLPANVCFKNLGETHLYFHRQLAYLSRLISQQSEYNR